MANSQIFEKLEKMYKDEKSKNFVLHLIRSYLPLNKPGKVFEKPVNIKKFKCALTDSQLISIDELFEYIHTDEFSKNFFKGLKEFAGTISDNGPRPERSDITALKEFLKGRVQGWQGHETTTYLSQEAIEELYNWTATKILQGDGKINWTMRSMMPKNVFTPKKQVKREDSPVQAVIKQNKPAKESLGDFDALKNLKEKLQQSENGEASK